MANRKGHRRAGIVRAMQILDLTKGKVIIVNLNAIPHLHTHIPLLAVILAKSDTNNRYRYAQVSQHHAPMAAAKVSQTAPESIMMGSARMQLHQRENHHP